MPMIIDQNGKAFYINEIKYKVLKDIRYHREQGVLLSQLYDDLQAVSLHQASHEALDRLDKVYNLSAIRQDIEIIPADKIIVRKANSYFKISNSGKTYRARGMIGFTITEKIGIGIINPRAIAKLSK